MSSILVVDDEPDIRLLCRLILEGAGHRVSEAATAEVALGLLRTTSADFVVLDIRMPGMGGWEMLARVQHDERLDQMKVIICSAHAGPVDQRRASAEGAHGFLAKPFLPDELLRVVQAAPAPAG
ncbi:MAG: response regulator [Jatrophihabitantaceae bacterium]